jgi:hypothetical protein
MPSPQSRYRQPVFILRRYYPSSRRERSRARRCIRRALRTCRGHIERSIGDPARFNWVSVYVLFPMSMILTDSIRSYCFHGSDSEPRQHWTVRAVRHRRAFHTLHVFDDGHAAESFANGGAHRHRRRIDRVSYVSL